MIRLVTLRCSACRREWQDTTASYDRRGPSCPYCGQRHREAGIVRRALDAAREAGARW